VRPVDLFLLSQGATRYNGAPPVTVLQHSALVLAMGDAVGLSPRLREVFALHDLAGEPYAGEVVTGLKTYTHRLREDLAEGRVREVLGVAKPTADEKAVCKTFDLLALSAEMTVWEHAGLSVWCPEPATPMARDLARRWTQEASDKECWELLVSAVPALANPLESMATVAPVAVGVGVAWTMPSRPLISGMPEMAPKMITSPAAGTAPEVQVTAAFAALVMAVTA
jgi:hypothetical protein